MSGKSGLRLFSCYWAGEKPDNRHQIKMFSYDEEDEMLRNFPNFYFIINREFCSKLWKSTPVELIEEFLNYHFDKYDGIKSIFLRCTEEIIDKEIKRRKGPHLRDHIILDWIGIKEEVGFSRLYTCF
jgi:hypothetical protein